MSSYVLLFLFSIFFISMHACKCGHHLGVFRADANITCHQSLDSCNEHKYQPLGNKRNKNVVVSSKEGMQREITELKGSIPDDVEENVDSKEEVEDVVAMDYAQPHRKPPIHNQKN